jgi:hypothetical protein
MIKNTWVCHDDVLINAEPSGSITAGCYVKNRAEVKCGDCGFTPVAEASGALDLITRFNFCRVADVYQTLKKEVEKF